jgi:hypothetical protein
MILFIPYHEDIPVSYNELARSILEAGTNPNHTLAVISLRSQDHGSFMFGNALTDYFGRHLKISIDDRPERAADTSNRFFTAALNAFRKYKPAASEAKNSPMMYFDPSYVPNNPRWLDDLQADYFRQGAPSVFGKFGLGDEKQIPVGPLILSREFADKSTLLSFIPQGSHWRNYLAWELYKNRVEASGIGSHDSAVVIPQSARRKPPQHVKPETPPAKQETPPAKQETPPAKQETSKPLKNPDPASVAAMLSRTSKSR